MSGYVSEKIVNAFAAGSIPIYYGTTDIFKIFNHRAFIFFNSSNPERALRQIKRLERNSTEFHQVLSEPILTNGTFTVNEYFSLSGSVGDGRLRNRILSLVC